MLRLFFVLMLLAACSDPSGPGAHSLRVTASVTPAMPLRPNVAVTVHNRGSRLVRIFRCGDQVRVSVERRVPRGWEAYAGGFCIATALAGAVEVAPGASASAAVYVPDPGIYRVRVEAWYGDDPESARTVVSESVTIP